MKDEFQKEVQSWILKAEEDLNLVIKLLQEKDAEYFASSIGFHCQQAIEKYLKAFLVSQAKAFKKTHDLNLLRDICAELDNDFSKLEFGNLLEFAVDYRYPDEAYIPDLEEIVGYKELALNVKFIITAKIV
jgi:HEPN domain-containing protein